MPDLWSEVEREPAGDDTKLAQCWKRAGESDGPVEIGASHKGEGFEVLRHNVQERAQVLGPLVPAPGSPGVGVREGTGIPFAKGRGCECVLEGECRVWPPLSRIGTLEKKMTAFGPYVGAPLAFDL